MKQTASKAVSKTEAKAGPVVVEFTSIDLYEQLLAERERDPTAFARKYSGVMGAAVEGYERARSRAVERAKAKHGD